MNQVCLFISHSVYHLHDLSNYSSILTSIDKNDVGGVLKLRNDKALYHFHAPLYVIPRKGEMIYYYFVAPKRKPQLFSQIKCSMNKIFLIISLFCIIFRLLRYHLPSRKANLVIKYKFRQRDTYKRISFSLYGTIH